VNAATNGGARHELKPSFKMAMNYPGSIPGSARFSSSPQRPDRLWGLPPIQWVPGALSPGVKRQGREADHSPLPSAEVKKGGAIPPLPHMSSRHSA
jgi:hypothetical protein